MAVDRIFRVGLALGAASVIGLFGYDVWRGGVQGRDEPLPAIPARLVSGAPLVLDGSPTVLHVWLPGCGICAREVPGLEAVRARHPGVRQIDLSVVDDVSATVASARRMGLTGELAVTTGNALTALDVHEMPTTLFIGSDGRVVAVGAGALREDVLERETARLR